MIGAVLGFPTLDTGQLTDPGSAIIHRLHQIYQDTLRHFDQAYISSIGARLGSVQTSHQDAQSTPADHQQISATVASELSTLTSDRDATDSVPPLPHSSCAAELGVHRVPQDFESVQPIGFYPGPTTSTEHAQHVYPARVNRTPGFQVNDYPSTHSIQIHQHQRPGREPMPGSVINLTPLLQVCFALSRPFSFLYRLNVS